jgi:hypothetical protein
VDPALEACIKRAQDPTLVPGIYHYCDSRCERCAFSRRCLSFREAQEQRRQHGDRDLSAHLEANARQTVDLMRAWCEREGIDFETLEQDAHSEAADLEYQHARTVVDSDPLTIATTRYTRAAWAIVEPLRRLSPFHEWPPEVAAALETIDWNAGMIAAKLARALHGFHDRHLGDDEDAIQNDWNGSAKMVRLAIDESLVAWETLFAVGDTPPGADLRQTADALARIDADVATRFPQAMAFIRPGFDEPDVAAGALTSRAPFEPRRSVGNRLRTWLSRLAPKRARSRIFKGA